MTFERKIGVGTGAPELSDEELWAWYEEADDKPRHEAGDDTGARERLAPARPDTDTVRRVYAEIWRVTNAGGDATGVEHRILHAAGLAHLRDPSIPTASSSGGGQPPRLSDDELQQWYDTEAAQTEGTDVADVFLPNIPPTPPPTITELRQTWEWYWYEQHGQPGEHRPPQDDDTAGRSLKHRLLHKLGFGHG